MTENKEMSTKKMLKIPGEGGALALVNMLQLFNQLSGDRKSGDHTIISGVEIFFQMKDYLQTVTIRKMLIALTEENYDTHVGCMCINELIARHDYSWLLETVPQMREDFCTMILADETSDPFALSRVIEVSTQQIKRLQAAQRIIDSGILNPFQSLTPTSETACNDQGRAMLHAYVLSVPHELRNEIAEQFIRLYVNRNHVFGHALSYVLKTCDDVVIRHAIAEAALTHDLSIEVLADIFIHVESCREIAWEKLAQRLRSEVARAIRDEPKPQFPDEPIARREHREWDEHYGGPIVRSTQRAFEFIVSASSEFEPRIKELAEEIKLDLSRKY
ncbi:MAG: hypothetical protein WC477_01270 [Patescibacteria group bacterium]